MLAVQVLDLRKRYVSFRRRGLFSREKVVVEALKGVTFDAWKAEVLGILGPNGAGKSTLVKILATVLLPDSGTARILGHDIVEERREVRRLIGVMLSVERGFFLKLTGRENLKYFGMLYGLSGSALEKRVQEVLREVGLLKNADKPFEEYSLGMKARLGIARALLNDPEVLILDEPTLGLDPVSARRVRALIRSLAKEGGKTVLITTHNMFEAEIVCDRVAILSDGRIAAIDTVEDLKRKVADTVFLEVRVSCEHESSILQALRSVYSSVTCRREGPASRILIPVKVNEYEHALSELLETLRRSKLKLRGIAVREPTLEDAFVKIVGER
ncbi:MAG: ABC transporter ATP-binding protein [Thermofilum sp.]